MPKRDNGMKNFYEEITFVENKRHKCLDCKKEFATCDAGAIVWGIDKCSAARGELADKVIECESFEEGSK